MVETEKMIQKSVRNIYCVGRNYASFAEQMGNAMPEHPLIFMKPTHSLENMNGNTVSFYGNKGEVNCEAELVLHIGRPYEKGVNLNELVDKMTVGLDFTYREILNQVKDKGHPWTTAKGFPYSSTAGEFCSFSTEATQQHDFKLVINGETLQVGNVKNMIFSIQTIVDYVAENFGLGTGDLIYTGTPEGIGTLQDGDVLEVQWGEESLGSCKVALKQKENI
ncbi:fumarylacetoacetate hydrolase family protein [Peribacillus simplex]|uniref:fumarylacetoacetate hydrolase family protein n=1 Tax=Peribacillus simplex TaxID=1478 RepID=UPI0037F366C3